MSEEEDLFSYADPTTSEGIFVYASCSIAVDAGDVVRVTGTVTEFGTAPQNSDRAGHGYQPACVQQRSCYHTGHRRPAGGNRHRIGALRGHAGDNPTSSDCHRALYLGTLRRGAPGGRWPAPSSLPTPTHPAYPATRPTWPACPCARSPWTMVTGSKTPLTPSSIRRLRLFAANTLRIGDTVTNLTGVLDQRFDLYRIQPVGPVNFTHINTRPQKLRRWLGGNVRVAAFNMLNYFSTIDPNTGVLRLHLRTVGRPGVSWG